jgi:hypothetical protein
MVSMRKSLFSDDLDDLRESKQRLKIQISSPNIWMIWTTVSIASVTMSFMVVAFSNLFMIIWSSYHNRERIREMVLLSISSNLQRNYSIAYQVLQILTSPTYSPCLYDIETLSFIAIGRQKWGGYWCAL